MKKSVLYLAFILDASVTWAQSVTCNAPDSLAFPMDDASTTSLALCQFTTTWILDPTYHASVDHYGIGGSFTSIYYNELGCGADTHYDVPVVGVCEYFFQHILDVCGDVGGETWDVCGGYKIEHVI